MIPPDHLVAPVRGGWLAALGWPGQGPLVLGLHGLTANAAWFTPLAEALGGRVTLVAPHLRGRGGSEGLPGPYGLDAHVDDLRGLVAALGRRPDLVVGHGLGAWVATRLAYRAPDLAPRLLLLDGGAPLGRTRRAVDDELHVRLGASWHRLGRRYAAPSHYQALRRSFWTATWTPAVEAALCGDLVADPDGGYRVAVVPRAVREDAEDVFNGSGVAIEAAPPGTELVTVRAGSRYAPGEPPRLPPTVHLRSTDASDHDGLLLTPEGAALAAASVLAPPVRTATATTRRPRRRGRHAVAGLAALAVLSGAAIGLHADADARDDPGVRGGRAPAAAPAAAPLGGGEATARRAAAVAVLARRIRALRTGDEGAFLADLLPGAAPLAAEQSALFRRLRSLSLQDLSYALVPDHAFADTNALRRLGATAWTSPVVETYRIAGADAGPVASAQAYTFVRRDGRWWLAGDRYGLDMLPPGAHSDPWEAGDVAKAAGRRSVVIGPAAQADVLDDLARDTDRALLAVRRVWPVSAAQARRRVVVFLPSGTSELRTWFRGDEDRVEHTAAIDVPVYDRVEQWSSGSPRLSGSRIIVNPDAFDPGSAQFAELLRHELTHTATDAVNGDGAPLWLVEGFADYVALRRDTPIAALHAAGLDDRTAGRLDDGDYGYAFPPSAGFYDGDEATVEEHYVAGWLACLYIADRWNEDRLRLLYRRLASTRSEVFSSLQTVLAFRDVLGTTPEGFEHGLSRWLQREWDRGA